MPGILRKFTVVLQNLKTYQVGLLQAKAYRILKQHTAASLEHLGITSAEWAFLGMLFDRSQGIRSIEAAIQLGVEAPFVTKLVKKLQTDGLVDISIDPQDSRAKLLCLTKKGKVFVENTENYVRDSMRPLTRGVSRKDLAAYLLVLDAFVQNSQNSET